MLTHRWFNLICFGAPLFIVMTLYAPLLNAYQKGDAVVRAGVAVIDPRGDIGSITLSDMDLGTFGVEPVTIPVVNAGYFIIDHLSLEILLGKPPTFEISGTGGAIEGVPVGKIEAFPLVVVADYYPVSAASRWQPHIGAGVNYVVPGETSVNPQLASRFGAQSVEIKQVGNSWGLALSLGLDYRLSDKWLLAADAYYLDIQGRADIEVIINDQIYDAGLFGRTGLAPVMYSLALGYKF